MCIYTELNIALRHYCMWNLGICKPTNTHCSGKEWVSQRFLYGNAVLRLNDQTLSNEILGVLWKTNTNKLQPYPFVIIIMSNRLPEISAHSGDVKLYLPSMMLRSITICLRCQKGGHPTNSVNIITPQAHLDNTPKCDLNVMMYSNYALSTNISTSREYPGAFSHMLHLSVSGAKYPGVPHRSNSFWSLSSTLAKPKSVILTLKLLSSKMFSGLRSRCTISCEWM